MSQQESCSLSSRAAVSKPVSQRLRKSLSWGMTEEARPGLKFQGLLPTGYEETLRE